jgi:hypothetical protein
LGVKKMRFAKWELEKAVARSSIRKYEIEQIAIPKKTKPSRIANGITEPTWSGRVQIAKIPQRPVDEIFPPHIGRVAYA